MGVSRSRWMTGVQLSRWTLDPIRAHLLHRTARQHPAKRSQTHAKTRRYRWCDGPGGVACDWADDDYLMITLRSSPSMSLGNPLTRADMPYLRHFRHLRHLYDLTFLDCNPDACLNKDQVCSWSRRGANHEGRYLYTAM